MYDITKLEIIGEGATTKIYRDGDTAIKLYVNAPSDEADNEAKLQQFAHNAGLPVPVVYGVRKFENNIVALDMAYINGKPILQPKMDKEERRSAINTLVKLQCEIHKVHAKGLPQQTDHLWQKIKRTQRLEESLKENLLSLLARIGDNYEYLCHGDFHPLNVLYDGNKHWIIDWVDAVAGNPLADACRTYLIFKQYLSRSSGIYLKAFCKETCSRPDDILVWQPIIAAARLGENMDNQARAWLLAVVQE